MSQMPTVALVTGSPITKQHLTAQLRAIIGDLVDVQGFAFDEGVQSEIRGDLIVFSSAVLLTEDCYRHVATDCPRLIAKRIINYNHLDRLLDLPEGTRVLLVNDVEKAATDSITSLQRLGLDHLQYIPYTPKTLRVPDDVQIAITPGETSFVPASISRVVDIGPRLIDLTSIVEILQHFDLFQGQEINLSERYMKRIVDLSKQLARQHEASRGLNNHLQLVLDGVNGGILAMDAEGRITVYNENMEQFLKVPFQRAVGRQLVEVIRDHRLYDYIRTGEEQSPLLIQVGEYELAVHRFLFAAENAVVCTFRSTAETLEVHKQLRRELKNKGYVAKYGLHDIIGSSPGIQRVRELCPKLALSDLTILIEGESGTGKELFASAIHTLSERKFGPFLAANFSALPEELVESELFGYEEGAFTGAKKGGKQGLFEQADGGTIFLDEIGDISLKTQARLLRVLQEKELMRIGGNKIITVDVRVIAATNRNLEQMIAQGSFRQDLYHRLKVLYLRLPTLRQRKTDLEELFYHFVRSGGQGSIEVNPAVLHQLAQYEWYGNVRELKNTIDYMLAVCDGKRLTLSDIPDQHFFQKHTSELQRPIPDEIVEQQSKPEELMSGWEARGELMTYAFLLRLISEHNRSQQVVGRKLIAESSARLAHPLSEQQVRHRLDYLAEQGLVVKHRGRFGTKITALGDTVLRLLEQEGVS